MPIVIGAIRTIPKDLEKRLRERDKKNPHHPDHSTVKIRILRVLETWGNAEFKEKQPVKIGMKTRKE